MNELEHESPVAAQTQGCWATSHEFVGSDDQAGRCRHIGANIERRLILGKDRQPRRPAGADIVGIARPGHVRAEPQRQPG